MAEFSFELFIDVEAENIEKAFESLKKGLYKGNLPNFCPVSAQNMDTDEEWDEAKLKEMFEAKGG